MKVLVSGSTGLVGTELVRHLKRHQHEVIRLVRKLQPVSEQQVLWDISAGKLDLAQLEGIDAVVHLSGETVVGRWTARKKRNLVESRILSTQLLVERLSQLKNPPKVFICASAVEYYGDAGRQVLTEVSDAGHNQIANTCVMWEKLASQAEKFGARVAYARLGTVMSPKGGALKALYYQGRMGFLGAFGSGKQYVSWISNEDTARALVHMLETPNLSGPVNVVSPVPIQNAVFIETIRQALCPSWILAKYFPTASVPAWMLYAMLGDFAPEILLSSNRVLPVRLQETGFEFKHTNLKDALDDMLVECMI